MTQSTIIFIFGALLLVWALAVRRSRADSLALGLAGIFLIILELWPMIEMNRVGLTSTSPRTESMVAFILLVALAGAVIMLLTRPFRSSLPWYHRIGMGLAGVALSIPIFLLLGLMGIYALLGARVM